MCSHYILPKHYMHTQPLSCSIYCFCALAHTEVHTEKPAFQGSRSSVRQRSSVTDPSVQNKDLSSAVILSSQTRGFCMELAEPGLRLLFIYFICYQGLGKHNVPLVRRSTMCYKPLSDGFHYSDPVLL